MYCLNFDPGAALISYIFFNPSDNTNYLFINNNDIGLIYIYNNFTSLQHYRLVEFFGINVVHIAGHLMELPIFVSNINKNDILNI